MKLLLSDVEISGAVEISAAHVRSWFLAHADIDEPCAEIAAFLSLFGEVASSQGRESVTGRIAHLIQGDAKAISLITFLAEKFRRQNQC